MYYFVSPYTAFLSASLVILRVVLFPLETRAKPCLYPDKMKAIQPTHAGNTTTADERYSHKKHHFQLAAPLAYVLDPRATAEDGAV